MVSDNVVSPNGTDFSVSVILNDGSSAHIAGQLRVPTGATTVHLLLHGFTYAQYYWHLSYKPETYSYVAAANKIGYATFAIDRLGAGASDHPLSELVTLENQASVVNQVIQALLRGQIGDTAFRKIVLVGHSYGSMVALYTAGRYQSVDLLVITGMSHNVKPVQIITGLTGELVVATSDPKFASKDLDFGYLTTRASAREVFYYLEKDDKYKYVEKEVIDLDEASKDTGTDAEVVTLISLSDSLLDFSRQINIPVFVVDGAQDTIFLPPLPGQTWTDKTLAESERPFYGPQATVQALVVPNAGHDVTLHRSAPDTLEAIYGWVSDYAPVT